MSRLMFPKSPSFFVSAFLLVTLIGFTTGRAEPVRDGAVAAELLAENASIEPGKPFTVGLRLSIDDGWHTYWTNPGDAGFPTKIDWKLPEGFSAGPIRFPAPHRFEVDFGGLKQVGLGYTHDDSALHLVEITPPADLAPGTEITLAGKAGWLMCDDKQCVPGGAELTLTLPVESSPAAASAEADLFAEARRALPADAPDWNLDITESGEKELTITIAPPAGATLPEAASLVFYPEASNLIALDGRQTFASSEDNLVATLPKAPYFKELPTPVEAVLLSESGFPDFEGRRALRLSTAPGEPSSPTAPSDTNAGVGSGDASGGESIAADASPDSSSSVEVNADRGLFVTLLFGFLGGMILNIMPCVFPVISLKILSFVSHAGEERRKVLMHGAVYTFGILLFFLGLAGIVIALGLAWGGQFQSPVFVMVMTAVIVVLSLSLFGVFEFGVKLTGVGGELTQSSGYGGSFWSGALAVILATPCTGPFLGSTLGWALDQPPVVVVSFFTMMGLGMAAPYVVLTAFPALTKRLPRPGPWMETFKQVMGFPMMAAAIFLLWILMGQIGDTATALFMGALVLLCLAAWAWGRFATPGATSRTAGLATTGAAAIAAAVLSWFALQQSGEAEEGSGDNRPITEIIEGHRAEGKHVFVDFTARWCAICQTNKPAMHAEETQAAFEKLGVEFVIADWTNKSDDIYQFLKKHGRRSVPYYPLFPADQSKGPLELPQNLTTGIIGDYLEKLSDVEANFPDAPGD